MVQLEGLMKLLKVGLVPSETPRVLLFPGREFTAAALRFPLRCRTLVNTS